ncbi:MAG: 2-isopropylmalate synthase [Immundisolibacteraceae bacterium]|nr:2-isopropylmalate synthase [Immundisolibacteraceae bacterium]
MSKEKLIIFDTTMRDGEQSPGATMSREEKIRIGNSLERMGVDVIEAGFPAASEGDFEAVKAVAETVQESIVCGLCRTRLEDIDRAAEALKPARRGRIHTFIATSTIHMEKKLRMDSEDVIEQAVRAVRYARNFTDDVEFSTEDGGRSDFDFLCRIIEQAIDAGATTINVPDTVGYTFPEHYGALFKRLMETIPNADKAVFSAHCHNDLGMAVANSLAAVMNGARQVECAINGLGERAGNAALEEVVMAIRTRADIMPVEIGLDTTLIVPASRLVSSVTGFQVQPNKAVVGINAFTHESGIHQDGVLKARETYEIMRAQDVGWDDNRLTLGKLSGRSAFKDRLSKLGIEFKGTADLADAFIRFKQLADKKQEIFDEDLVALVMEMEANAPDEQYQLLAMRVQSEIGETPRANLVLLVEGKEVAAEAEGDGGVDATFKAIETIASSGAELLLYSVKNITEGTDSLGHVSVRLKRDGRSVTGQGADTDIVIASARAYVNALNRLLRLEAVAENFLGGV